MSVTRKLGAIAHPRATTTLATSHNLTSSMYSSSMGSRATGITGPSRQYVTGGFLVTLGMPRAVVEGTGQLHFAGMNLFPTGEILLRVNVGIDTDQGGVNSRYYVSTNSGQTFDAIAPYDVAGSHTNSEALLMGADGICRGGTYAEITQAGGTADATLNYQTIDQGGRRTVLTPNGITITGWPAAIQAGNNPDGHTEHISWNSSIVRIADNNWVSLIQVSNFVAGNCTQSVCIKSTDQGVTWTCLSIVNPNGYPGRGAEETCTRLLGDGRLMAVVRTGFAPCDMFFSVDQGVTWTGPTQLNAWSKAPFLCQLTGTGDMALVCGPAPISTDVYPACMGLYLTANPDAAVWPYVDLIQHHNSMMHAPYIYNPNTLPAPSWMPWSSAYMSAIELSPNHILINYDDTSYGAEVGSVGNRIYVVNATVERL